MLQLIVHADDFGLSEKVNEGILQAHRLGILTSASVMANGAAFEHAIEMWRSLPSLDLGIHLTLVEEQPVLDPAMVPSLVNETGQFYRHATIFAKRYFMGKIRLGEVRRELAAQINKVMSRGVTISHLDSHQHVHMLPQVLRVTLELAGEFGIGLPAGRFDELAQEVPRVSDQDVSQADGSPAGRSVVASIRDALENSNFKWRSLEWVAVEAGVSEEVAADALRGIPDEVRFSRSKKTKKTIVGLISRVGTR